MTKTKASTSMGGDAKLERAINQLENVERLLSGLPKKFYKEKKSNIKNIIREVENITERVRRELAEVN